MQKQNLTKITEYCRPNQMQLKSMLHEELLACGRTVEEQDGFLYSPGSHPVLLVAHLDTVHKSQPTDFFIDHTESLGGDLWCKEGIGGDDRCGVFIIMELVKKVDAHILFCEDEETCGIGAEKFSHSGIIPDVQFIVEFDRKGNNDAVFYECDNRDFVRFVEGFGFKEQNGSFSDISWIAPCLDIAAVNISCGYYQAHTVYEYIRLDDVESIIKRVIPLISDISTKYEYVERHWNNNRRHNGYGRKSFGWDSPQKVSNGGLFPFDSYWKHGKELRECCWCGEDDVHEKMIEIGDEWFCRDCVIYDSYLHQVLGIEGREVEHILEQYDELREHEIFDSCSECVTT